MEKQNGRSTPWKSIVAGMVANTCNARAIS
jgi:hypothetical protein